jgi:hypothetical protein
MPVKLGATDSLNRTIEGQIRQRPLQALLIAGGIGVLQDL